VVWDAGGAEPTRRTAARLLASATMRSRSSRPPPPSARPPAAIPLMSADCFPEVRSPYSTGCWFPKSLEHWLRLCLVYFNTKDNPLQTSASPINVPVLLCCKEILTEVKSGLRKHPGQGGLSGHGRVRTIFKRGCPVTGVSGRDGPDTAVTGHPRDPKPAGHRRDRTPP
jgi:hypothetical protein